MAGDFLFSGTMVRWVGILSPEAEGWTIVIVGLFFLSGSKGVMRVLDRFFGLRLEESGGGGSAALNRHQICFMKQYSVQ